MIQLNRKNLVSAMLMLLLGSSLASCTYVTPETENACPGLESDAGVCVQQGTLSIKKSFFGIHIDEKNNKVRRVQKTWMCGWAPVEDTGKIKNLVGLSPAPYSSRHCNVEFNISNDGKNLVAKEVNADESDRNKWTTLLTIPIVKHYFYERPTDPTGRELNKYAKVSNRKNWKLQTHMDLDLSRVSLHDNTKKPYIEQFFGSNRIEVSDIEVEEKANRNYLAFTIPQTNNYYGNYSQLNIRYNFMEFVGTPGFQVTPYDQSISKHMNILHIIGKKPNGINQIKYAAHWDLSEPKEICLSGFPDDERNFKQIAYDVIDEVNDAFVRADIISQDQKAFVISNRNLKYGFDLRCPTITWVEDTEKSLNAPLGIALVNSDIRTGEIIWGGAIVWGGLIDYIVNRDFTTASNALSKSTFGNFGSLKQRPDFIDYSTNFNLKKWSPGFKLAAQLPEINSLTNQLFVEKSLKDLQQLQKKNDSSPKTISIENNEIERISKLIAQQDINLLGTSFNFSNEANYISSLLNIANIGSSVVYNEKEQELQKLAAQDNQNIDDLLTINPDLKKFNRTLDIENTFMNHIDGWSSEISAMNSTEKLQASKSVIKNVLLHEVGHALGMGHQFAANKLPARGSIPNKYYNFLKAEAKKFHNYTSIMDYMSGRTEVNLPYEKVKLQKHDELVLRYLYKQEYATFKRGDDDFTFFTMPQNGVIPKSSQKSGENYQATYFPQCSDYDAWLATDPYCRRWDTGYDAASIVEQNYKEFSDSFISRMNSFTQASGGNPRAYSYWLWRKIYSLNNKNRAFYDHLRFQLSTSPSYKIAFSKIMDSKEALVSFSKACIDPTQAPINYTNDFTQLALKSTQASGVLKALTNEEIYTRYKSVIDSKNIKNLHKKSAAEFQSLEQQMAKADIAFTEIQKLCVASKKSLEIFKTLLTLKGPDHSVINYNDAEVPTGLTGGKASQDFSKIFGRYEQLGVLPIKLATLDVLTNTASTMQYGYWNIPKPKFNDPNHGKYGFYSLFPEEFTDIITSAIKNNMGFGGTILEDNASLSISNLYMSYFLNRTFYYSNDNRNKFHSTFIDNIKAQTNFNVNMVAILLKSINKQNIPKNKVFGFRPQLFNLAQRELKDLPEAYMLPDRKVVVRGNEGQIILPLTKVRFLDQNNAFAWALEVTYDKPAYNDTIDNFTIKKQVSSLTRRELKKCIDGNNGLANYFSAENKQGFEGFIVAPNIATDLEAQNNFDRSLHNAFTEYQNKMKPEQVECQDTIKGVGLIGATALSLNGWILPQVFDYIKK